jgi:hypothetical protein
MDSVLNDGEPFIVNQQGGIGLSRKVIRRLLAERRIRALFRGVYVDVTVADSRALRARGLRLVAPEGAVLCESTAAFLHGIDTFTPGQRFLQRPKCMVVHHTSRSRQALASCREGYVRDEDVQEFDGLRLTTPVRTTADLMRTQWRPYALGSADAMVRAGLVDLDELADHLHRLKGYPGIVQARGLRALINPLAESPGESALRLRLIDAGLPSPRLQIVVSDPLGYAIVRLDLGYDEVRAGLEYDGLEFHTTPAERERDARKRVILQESLGWRLLVVGRESVFGPDPSLEVTVGEWVGVAPRLPRPWVAGQGRNWRTAGRK